jgi:hypothetical protein
LKLEGKLVGAWVRELERVWQSASAQERILVDLCSVSFVDDLGKELLSQMYRRGARLVAGTPLMKQIVEEITGAEEVGHSALKSEISGKENGFEREVNGGNTAGKGSRAH